MDDPSRPVPSHLMPPWRSLPRLSREISPVFAGDLVVKPRDPAIGRRDHGSGERDRTRRDEMGDGALACLRINSIAVLIFSFFSSGSCTDKGRVTLTVGKLLFGDKDGLGLGWVDRISSCSLDLPLLHHSSLVCILPLEYSLSTSWKVAEWTFRDER